MRLDVSLVQSHAQAIAEALWAVEKANPGIDFSALHAAHLAAWTDAQTAAAGQLQPLDGGSPK